MRILEESAVKAKAASWMENTEEKGRLKELEHNLKTLNHTILAESHRISLNLKILEESLTKAEKASSTEGKGTERLLWGMSDFMLQQQDMQAVLPQAKTATQEVSRQTLLGEPIFKVTISTL